MKSDKEILRNLGSSIQKRRKSMGWSQEKLAIESDTDRSYIGAIERGERNVGILTLLRILNALKISFTELLDEES
jgi:transcriptional regulator with XRE-family HTH domain